MDSVMIQRSCLRPSGCSRKFSDGVAETNRRAAGVNRPDRRRDDSVMATIWYNSKSDVML